MTRPPSASLKGSRKTHIYCWEVNVDFYIVANAELPTRARAGDPASVGLLKGLFNQPTCLPAGADARALRPTYVASIKPASARPKPRSLKPTNAKQSSKNMRG